MNQCSPETYKKALDFIKLHEGCKLTAYLDTGGVWTIGYGSIEGVKQGMVITQEEAERRLMNDFLNKAVEPVSRLLKVPCSNEQLIALYSFVFNIGETQFRKSTLLKKLNSNAPKEEIAKEFLRWKFDNGKEIAGLLNRRKQEKEMFLA